MFTGSHLRADTDADDDDDDDNAGRHSTTTRATYRQQDYWQTDDSQHDGKPGPPGNVDSPVTYILLIV